LLYAVNVQAQGEQPDDGTAARVKEAKQAQELGGRKIRLHLKDATIDDQIIELARAADANIFADATHFPDTSPPVSGDSEYSIFFCIGSLMESHNLSRFNLSRFSEGTLTDLFWREPDIESLTRKLVHGASVKQIGEPLDDRALDMLLRDYLQRTYGWDGRAPGFAKDIKMAALPPEIRVPLLAWTQQYASNNAGASETTKAWYSEAAWRGARLWIRRPAPLSPNEHVSTGLWVGLGGTYKTHLGPSGGPQAAIGSLDDIVR